METTIIALSSSFTPVAMKKAMSGNIAVVIISVLVLIVVIAGFLLLRRRK